MTKPVSPSSNAWLETVAFREGALRIRVGIRVNLRGARTPAFGLRQSNGGPRVVGPIPADAVNTGGGRITADFTVPLAAMLGHGDPAPLAGSVMEAAIELVDDRHAWIEMPTGFQGLGEDCAGRRLSLRTASDGIMTVRDRRSPRLPQIEAPQVATPRRIMILVNQITFGGGKTKAMFQLADMLAEAGHQVTLTALWAGQRPPLFPLSDRVGFDHIDGEHIAMPADRASGESQLGSILEHATRATDERLASYLKASDFDFVYIPNYDSALYRIVVENLPETAVRVLGDHNGQRGERVAAHRVNRHFRFGAQSFDAIHTVNPLLGDAIGTLTDREVFTIPNSIDAIGEPADDEHVFATRRIVAIGRLVTGKRMAHVLDAFARIADRFPAWSLDIYGRGPQETTLAHRIAALGLPRRVALRGFDPDVGTALERGAILVSASRTEAHPLAMIEAMAASCPVVSYDMHWGARALIRDGETGFLAQDGERGRLAARMAEVMTRVEARDPALLGVVAAAGAATAPFARDRVKAQWLAKIDELCERKRSERGGLLGRLRRAAAWFRPRSRGARATPRAT